MSIVRLTCLYCDGNKDECPQNGEPYTVAPAPDGDTAAEQRAVAKLWGWRRIRGNDYCPHCAKLEKSK